MLGTKYRFFVGFLLQFLNKDPWALRLRGSLVHLLSFGEPLNEWILPLRHPGFLPTRAEDQCDTTV